MSASPCYDELKALRVKYGTSIYDHEVRRINRERVESGRDKREFVPWKDVRKLAKRQRWVCGICESKESRMADDRQYTVLDHIDPQRIDFNNPLNWQAAHKSCNAKKAAKNQTEVSKMKQLENLEATT